MKIYILLAHPDKDTFNGRLADAYEQAATAKGHNDQQREEKIKKVLGTIPLFSSRCSFARV